MKVFNVLKVLTVSSMTEVFSVLRLSRFLRAVKVSLSNVSRMACCYLARKNGPVAVLITCSVVLPSTIATIFEWWEVPMKSRSWPFSL